MLLLYPQFDVNKEQDFKDAGQKIWKIWCTV